MSLSTTNSTIPDAVKTLSKADELIGKIAFKVASESFQALVGEPEDFSGALYVLTGFTNAQLAAFAKEVQNCKKNKDLLWIQFPTPELKDYGIPSEFIVSKSAVNVRNQERNGKIVITNDKEEDVGASLSYKNKISSTDLKVNEGIAEIWVEVAGGQVSFPSTPELTKQIIALVSAVLDTGRFSHDSVADYLLELLSRFSSGSTLQKSAGLCLPMLGLPLYEDCFSALSAQQLNQRSQWLQKLEAHSKNDCYLSKRGTDSKILDPDQLRQKLESLKTEQKETHVPDETLSAFENYINADGTICQASKDLLFKHDWSITQNFFDRRRKLSSKRFVEDTRSALEIDGKTPSEDDDVLLSALEKGRRKSGGANQDQRKFFETYQSSIEKFSKSLHGDWEDYVYGKKVECGNFLLGIIEALQRNLSSIEPEQESWVLIEGKRQATAGSLYGANPKACAYFERNYKRLPQRTNNLIRFQTASQSKSTLLPEYSEKVEPLLQKQKKGKRKGRVGKDKNIFEFQVVLVQKAGSKETRRFSVPLVWKFNPDSILASEQGDLEAILRFAKDHGSAAVLGKVDYETVGNKGIPLSVSLDNVKGFSTGPRGKGSLIPSQASLRCLTEEAKEILEHAHLKKAITEEEHEVLLQELKFFDELYLAAIKGFTTDALHTETIPKMVDSYKAVLDSFREIKHEKFKRDILKAILNIGNVTVSKSNHRPQLSVICPWHPLRLEAIAARQLQLLKILQELLSKTERIFSDGKFGSLYFQEVKALEESVLLPEIGISWNGVEAITMIHNQGVGGYSLNEPYMDNSKIGSLENNSKESVKIIMDQVDEYLRLQPHERHNLTILLYNCDSPELPGRLVDAINKRNLSEKGDKLTCQIFLTHYKETHLQNLYRELVAEAGDQEKVDEDVSEDFLSKVRVNISAASKLEDLRDSQRSQPVDIAYCRDIFTQEAKISWDWIPVQERDAVEIFSNQWNRLLPYKDGDERVRTQLTCPVNTPTGWSYLYSVGMFVTDQTETASLFNLCPAPIKSLQFNNNRIKNILESTHDLAVWVVNQDQMLDRRLLESQQIKVIRYIQSTVHGRNLVISSKARETLLVNSIVERLKALLPETTPEDVVDSTVERIIEDSNSISGGLILKASRRSNNTNELFGMVLSKLLVQSEVGFGKPATWCFLDDYSHWIGKKEGSNIADLLVLSPSEINGNPHLDIIVTEAKFVAAEGVAAEKARSAKQLTDTLIQISEALSTDPRPLDQDIWLARISDLVMTRTVCHDSLEFDPEEWRTCIRKRQCTFSVKGYSHVFVHSASDTPISTFKGIDTTSAKQKVDGFQEVFGVDLTKELCLQILQQDVDKIKLLRLNNGHPGFDRRIRALTLSKRPHPEPPVNLEVDQKQKISDIEDLSHDSNKQDSYAEKGESETAAKTEESEVIENVTDAYAFMEARANLHSSEDDAGNEWLAETTKKLRLAVLTRGLSAALPDGFDPILTPNAAIVKFKGESDMTMKAVEGKADEIYTSDGLRILTVSPEPGRVSVSIARPDRRILYTSKVYTDLKTRGFLNPNNGSVFVGIKEEDSSPLFLNPFIQPHTLVAGATGSGKSVFIQNLILYIGLTTSPDESHIYLIDAKNGVDYLPLQFLPHLVKGSGGIIDKTDASIEVFQALILEMEKRYDLFKEAKVKDCRAYRKKTGKVLPTIWVIHDEFADWMKLEEYAEHVTDSVDRLSIKARAAGIFLVFAAQRPDNSVMPMQLRSQLSNRLILKVSDPGTSEIATGEKSAHAERLLPQGHMMARTGESNDFVYVQVPYIDEEEEMPMLVQLIRKQHGFPEVEDLPKIP